MIVTLHLSAPEELGQEDAVLLYGWFSIETRGITLLLFADRGCMLFATTADLLTTIAQMLQRRVVKKEILAVGYGATVLLTRDKDQLIVRNAQIDFSLNLKDFAQALAIGAQQLADHIATINSTEFDERLISFQDYCKVLHDVLKSTAE